MAYFQISTKSLKRALNDMKFVNTARMIEKKAHIDVKSPVFRKIQLRIMMLLFQNPSVI